MFSKGNKSILICLAFLIVLVGAGAYFGFSADEVEAFDSLKHYEKISGDLKGVKTYKADVDRMVSDMEKSNANLDSILTTVTFSRKLTIDELKDLKEKYNMDIDAVEFRLMKNGDRSTAMLKFNGSFEDLKAEIKEISQDQGDELIGVIDVYCQVDSKDLSGLSKDDRVYLADISGDNAANGNFSKTMSLRNVGYNNPISPDYPHALSWELEDLGIVK